MSYYRYNSFNVREVPCQEQQRNCQTEPPRHHIPNPCPPFPPPTPPCPTGSFYRCDHTRIYNTGSNPNVVLQANPDNISGYADDYFSLKFNESGPQGLITSGSNFTLFSSSAGATGYGPVLVWGNYNSQYYASNGNVSIGDEARSNGGNRNFIFGSYNNSIGDENYILGMNNATTGSYNYILGNSSSIQGAGSYAFGQNLTIPFSRVRTYAFGYGNTVETNMPDILYPTQPNIQLLNDQGVAAILSTDPSANGYLRLNGTGSFAEAEHIVSRDTGYFESGLQVTGDLVVKTIRSPSGDLIVYATPNNEINLRNPVHLQDTPNRYSYLRLSGGNSDGALWGYYPYNNVDGVYLSYNYYVKNDSGGSPQVVIPNNTGGTAAILVAFDRISFRLGPVNTVPTELVRLEATTFRTAAGINMDIGTSGQPWQRIYGVTGNFSDSVNTPRVVVDSNVVITSSNITFNQPGADKIIQSTSLGNMRVTVYPGYIIRFGAYDGTNDTGVMQILTGARALQPLNSGGPVNLGVPADRWNILYAGTGLFNGTVEITGVNNANKFVVRSNAGNDTLLVNTTNNSVSIRNSLGVGLVNEQVNISTNSITFTQSGADKFIRSTGVGNMLISVYNGNIIKFSESDGINNTGVMQILTAARALQPLVGEGPVNLGIGSSRWTRLYANTGFFNGTVEITGDNNANKFVVKNNSNQSVFWVDTTTNTAFIYGNYAVTSDQNEKEDIENISFGLNLIKALQAKSYKMKRDSSGKRNFGFLAQQFKETLENLGIDPIENEFVVEYNEEGMSDVLDEEGNVMRDSEGNIIRENNGVFTKKYGIKYSNLYAPMVKGIQELATENDQLKNDVQTLQTDNDQLKTDVQTLQTDNAQLKTDVQTLQTELLNLNTRFETLIEDYLVILARLNNLENPPQS